MLLLGRKLLALVPVLVGVSLCTFFVFTLLPGDAAEQLLGADATPDRVAQLRADLNLEGRPWERYREWVGGVITGDLGRSIASGVPVITLLADRAPVTLQLLSYALLIAVGLAVPAALLAARWPNGIVERSMTMVSMASLSVPNYVFAIVLVYVLAVTLPWFPAVGYTPASESILKNMNSLALPALSIALPLFGFYAQFLRSDLLAQMQREAYVVTAAAKGIGPWRVLTRHVLRNSLFGLLTIIGLNFGALIGGTVVIEQIFGLPGVGQLLLQSVSIRDVTVVQAIVLLIAFATVLANTAVDISYTVLDPRVRLGAR